MFDHNAAKTLRTKGFWAQIFANPYFYKATSGQTLRTERFFLSVVAKPLFLQAKPEEMRSLTDRLRLANDF